MPTKVPTSGGARAKPGRKNPRARIVVPGDRGIKVSCICPQGVQTNMLFGEKGERKGFLQEGSVTAEHVAAVTLEGVADERFLILPHPEVLEYYRRKGQDYDRWLRGMRRLHDKVMQEFGGIAV